MGENDLRKISVKGATIEQVMRKFKLARWYIRMEMAGTPELAQRICSLANKVTEIDSGRGGRMAEFNSDRVRVDRIKYPAFASSGFTVSMDRRGRKINFEAQYEVPSLDNRRATEEGIKNWISENLESPGQTLPLLVRD